MESIRAEHLRIGNIVNDEDGFPMYIAGFKASKYGYRFIDSAGNTGLVKELSGITLTPEIILKAGFEKLLVNILGPNCFSNGTDYYITEDEGVYQLDRSCDKNLQEWDHIAGVDYLHQIQNLYHALTSTELKIEL